MGWGEVGVGGELKLSAWDSDSVAKSGGWRNPFELLGVGVRSALSEALRTRLFVAIERGVNNPFGLFMYSLSELSEELGTLML